ncbi:MAG TPA: FAD-dependent oxidoreductase [Chthoniobacterales bacterium]|jgi:thioredoxin reductase (NADPH)|nr:FAD-dependent oxidoreductase [Chthoniobacterales bacterium]
MRTTEEEDEQFYRDTETIAFPKIDDRQLALLDPLGERRRLRRGEMVFKAGQRDLPLIVVLQGEIEIFEKREETEQVLGTPGERDFAGDVAMLQGTSALASARVKSEEAEILQVPAVQLRRALAELPGVAEPVVNAFIMRRKRLMRDREFAGFRVIARRDSRDGRHLHDFLTKNHVPHRLLEFEDDGGATLARRFNLTSRDLPALITATGAPLRKPSLREVAQIAGLLRPLATAEEEEIRTDLTIVGAGPAGLAAAVYAGSEGLKTVVLESYAPGGQAGSSSLIENFFGFPTGISGGDLTYLAQLQAYRFGARFSTPSQALSITLHPDGEYRACLQIEGCMASLHTRALLIATGADYRRIDAEGREELEGSGVYYAATAFEGQLCRGATVVVAGAGNSAGQAAMFLSEGAAKVLLVVRGAGLSQSMSSYLSRRVETRENIEILYQTEIRKMTGGKMLEAVEIENTRTGERRTIETPAVFSMIGAKPCTGWLPPEIECDPKGFIKTGTAVAASPLWQKAQRPPGPLETSVPGIFAAGDVRSGSVKRCAAAVGEGGMAVAGIHVALGESG